MSDKFDILRTVFKRKNNKEDSDKFLEPEQEIKNISEKNPNKKQNNNITFIIIALILATSYFVVENNKISYQEHLRRENLANLENCLDESMLNYKTNWNAACKSLSKKDGCLLPTYRAENVEKWRREAEANCFKKYK